MYKFISKFINLLLIMCNKLLSIFIIKFSTSFTFFTFFKFSTLL